MLLFQYMLRHITLSCLAFHFSILKRGWFGIERRGRGGLASRDSRK